ncbi:Endoplasmic reticulum metallopeptidase 1 [Auxenochlorella protothecoides]|uniref:Endoplasmic reticulum metallopeptidase 1 n=1 Tax=Auxenochlorella protothecoides TaxID=3075 RepID=A0A087SS05_AUXPR|nr:Endoplasmic reticulum metallopeptidase 1 [Auxenochlorella protothecoides]KFM28509.1 Endoplasmic reticulum metallopeptidase 1 [Auxenochlorella protothecoides]
MASDTAAKSHRRNTPRHLFGVYSTMFALVAAANWYSMRRVPAPLPSTAPANVFSEERAMLHVRHLADVIGDRQVSTPGLEEAARYLLSVFDGLAEEAARSRPDLVVEASIEKVTDSMTLKAFGHTFGNAYVGLSNVVLRIAPARGPGARAPAVLVNSHFDSAMGSVGASDAATCIGVMLEVARVVVANRGRSPAAPLVLLLNGGEETLMQAAHGFMRHGAHAPGLGAFVNLESTGPWGPDVLFQSSLDWTLPAYARSAPHPRGNTVFQDFFDLGLIPADTDYRLFSYRRAGSLPGIDVAQVFDGLAYHTNQDVADRVRPGTLQSMGENTLAATLEFARVLGSGQPPPASAPGDGYVAFDLAGLKMVVYSYALASRLHHVPLVILFQVLLGSLLLPAANPRALRGFGLKAAAGGTLRAFFSVLLALVVPALLGATRALVTGAPIAWYGRYWQVYCTFFPAALAGLLLPYVLCTRRSSQPDAMVQSLGSATFHAAVASILAAHGIYAGYLNALWATGTILAVVLAWARPGPVTSLLAAALMALPLLVSMPVAVTALLYVTEKIGLAGAAPGLLGLVIGDVAIGTLAGVAGLEARWTVSAIDGFPVASTLPPHLLQHARPTTEPYWETVYPLNRLMQGLDMPAPPLENDTALPTLTTVAYGASPADASLLRWELELGLVEAGLGMVNCTGAASAWSFGEELAPVQTQGGFPAHLTRFSTAWGSKALRFWIDAAPGQVLSLTTHVAHLDATPATQEFLAQLPDWVSPVIMTTVQQKWNLEFR